jgi:hypothetical protein
VVPRTEPAASTAEVVLPGPPRGGSGSITMAELSREAEPVEAAAIGAKSPLVDDDVLPPVALVAAAAVA